MSIEPGSSNRIWHLITGEYPPQSGGVADYTLSVARALAATRDEVHVWTSTVQVGMEDPAVYTHELPGHFDPRSLVFLTDAFARLPTTACVLVQYVPQAYGLKGMNLPFCGWLRWGCPVKPWVMFHEVAYPISRRQSLRHNVLGRVTRLMAKLAADSAARAFVSTTAWLPLLRKLSPTARPEWLPVPSSIDNDVRQTDVHRFQAATGFAGGHQLVGHFGTYGTHIASLLLRTLPSFLRSNPQVKVLLLGRGGEGFGRSFMDRHPDLCGRIQAPGELPAREVAVALRACDLLYQPYADGATTRRTSLMAGLALGQPIVTTRGKLSESIWEQGMVALSSTEPKEIVQTLSNLLHDEVQREELGRRARAAYQNMFSLAHTVRVLRDEARAISVADGIRAIL